jgi:hypothetical protein
VLLGLVGAGLGVEADDRQQSSVLENIFFSITVRSFS